MIVVSPVNYPDLSLLLIQEGHLSVAGEIECALSTG